ncbi:MAG: hypothetical protein ACYDAQ_17390 [Mycobacteriales bacterium]
MVERTSYIDMSVVSLWQQAFLMALPHGGQHGARRNALGAIAVDRAAARDRVEAGRAVARAGAVRQRVRA